MLKQLIVLIVIAGLLPAPLLARTYEQALPGYHFQFPRDHASHEEYKAEWWYYTGHLKTSEGRKFGYELTFFRRGTAEDAHDNAWATRNIYLAHFAISDEQGKKFFFREKLNRKGVGLAEARDDIFYVRNENWLAEALGNDMHLQAETPDYSVHLSLQPLKEPIVHGQNGVSQKASCKGCASHYYSFTRLQTKGTLFLGKQAFPVEGLSWMDHEFGSNQLTSKQVGWDWFSIQLSDNTELMLYLIRNADGTVDPNSSGTMVYANGQSEHLKLPEFSVRSERYWLSPETKGKYPIGWKISIPRLKLELSIEPSFDAQELVTTRSTGVTYWEGSASVAGKKGTQTLSGSVYVEMTGYAEHVGKQI